MHSSCLPPYETLVSYFIYGNRTTQADTEKAEEFMGSICIFRADFYSLETQLEYNKGRNLTETVLTFS